jgi:hypothetical protein
MNVAVSAIPSNVRRHLLSWACFSAAHASRHRYSSASPHYSTLIDPGRSIGFCKPVRPPHVRVVGATLTCDAPPMRHPLAINSIDRVLCLRLCRCLLSQGQWRARPDRSWAIRKRLRPAQWELSTGIAALVVSPVCTEGKCRATANRVSRFVSTSAAALLLLCRLTDLMVCSMCAGLCGSP